MTYPNEFDIDDALMALFAVVLIVMALARRIRRRRPVTQSAAEEDTR